MRSRRKRQRHWFWLTNAGNWSGHLELSEFGVMYSRLWKENVRRTPMVRNQYFELVLRAHSVWRVV